MNGRTFLGWFFVVAILGMPIPAWADIHAPWPADWNNWSDPNLWVTVGDPGNAGEGSGEGYGGSGSPGRICGAVDYEYKIGKYEVTAGQYCAFLNAVAGTDTYGLYNTYMANLTNYCGCNIQQSGLSGSYAYSVDPNWANRPVNWVSWGDAARFANWLTNGQPTGAQDANTTEDGSYYLNGATSTEALLAVIRKTPAQGGRYYIPTEDEWYKAAYYKAGSTNGGYWDYPTGSDSSPSNALLTPDGGNNANVWQAYYSTIGSPYYRTEVGEFENSESPYGTFDQGGNVWEWNEAIIGSSYRGMRGGALDFYSSDLLASYRGYGGPATQGYILGFRVSEVPEPASMAVLAVGSIGLLMRRRGLRR